MIKITARLNDGPEQYNVVDLDTIINTADMGTKSLAARVIEMLKATDRTYKSRHGLWAQICLDGIEFIRVKLVTSGADYHQWADLREVGGDGSSDIPWRALEV
jgi:hypothetical protein